MFYLAIMQAWYYQKINLYKTIINTNNKIDKHKANADRDKAEAEMLELTPL